MSFSFLPTYRTEAITDLTPEMPQAKNIRLLMLDFDNTIVPYTTNIPTPEMEAWLKMMVDSPVQIAVVSNSRNDRVKIFCEKYGIDCITRAKKPGTKGILECVGKYAMPKENCALAGDQIYTDTLGGNRAGVRSILVKAIHNHNIWLKLRHVAEMPFILLAKNRRFTK